MTDPARPSLARLLIGGAVAGLAASAAMTAAQRLMERLEEDDGGEPSGQAIADVASEAVTGEPVPERHRHASGLAVHYATGTALGALYAVSARWLPEVRAGWGTGYGVAVSALLDEGLVPALGLSEGPTEVPLSAHVEGGVAHLVYGMALESAVRVIVGRVA